MLSDLIARIPPDLLSAGSLFGLILLFIAVAILIVLGICLLIGVGIRWVKDVERSQASRPKDIKPYTGWDAERRRDRNVKGG